jgi:hypothetical protein
MGIPLHLPCVIEESLTGWWFRSNGGLATDKQSHISELGEYKVKFIISSIQTPKYGAKRRREKHPNKELNPGRRELLF